MDPAEMSAPSVAADAEAVRALYPEPPPGESANHPLRVMPDAQHLETGAGCP